MSLERLGASLADRYTIDRELGAGGMATVYLARDIKHGRQVAIKVLRPELAAVIGAERFLAEIKTTANLQHPHILSLFDSGTVDGTVFYVMPFVDGESLRDKLAREKQLPVDESIRIATEVADALQYAHAHGVIHRDIKPENILLQGGHALVADFGIALAASKTGGTRMTETGMSLGTPQYMSPEQAMGERELDARSDIYALGCVTYEMLSGEAPFTGPTAQAIVAKIITEPAPSVRSKRPSVPDAVDVAIQVAMQKTPADRFRTAAEFASALSRPAAARSGLRAASGPRRSRRAGAAMWLGGGALLAIAFVLGGRVLGRGNHVTITLGHAHHVTWEAGLEIAPALSPDGRTVAYATGPLTHTHIEVRPVGEGRALRLTADSETVETAPQWSADGSRILFLSRGGVFSAPAGGGPAKPEIPGVSDVAIASATWAPDGNRIAFARHDSLLVRDQDGTVHQLAPVFDPSTCTWSPVGSYVACTSGNSLYSLAGQLFGNLSPSRVVLVRVRDGAVTTITDSTSLNASPAWAPDGRQLYFVSDRDGSRDIYLTTISSSGHGDVAPIRLSAGLGAHTISTDRSSDRLAYSLYTRRSSAWSIPKPAHPPERTTAATRITGANEYIEQFSVSADGKWLYYDSDLTGNADIFRVATGGGEPEQLTNNPADDFAPFPSHDGTEFSFHSWRTGTSREIFVQRLDGGGVDQVTKSPLQEGLGNFAPDDRTLAFTMMTETGGVWLVHRKPGGGWETPVERVAYGFFPNWSPDGKQLTFTTSLRGGSVLTVPVDSGPVRTIVDASRPGTPVAGSAGWGADGTIYFSTTDSKGTPSIWSIGPAGGSPQQLLIFDAALHPSYRPVFAIVAGKFYFVTEDRQSDVWVMDVRRQ
jgi:Tol biopolymer transport system component